MRRRMHSHLDQLHLSNPLHQRHRHKSILDKHLIILSQSHFHHQPLLHPLQLLTTIHLHFILLFPSIPLFPLQRIQHRLHIIDFLHHQLILILLRRRHKQRIQLLLLQRLFQPFQRLTQRRHRARHRLHHLLQLVQFVFVIRHLFHVRLYMFLSCSRDAKWIVVGIDIIAIFRRKHSQQSGQRVVATQSALFPLFSLFYVLLVLFVAL
mmetsp:Transcript_20751/g.33065  ORF Transcript_20751/g.33065 Transcript_20751/m.33065 type:complete len:208 (+) Transcript_20751:226-849(+)